MLLEALLEQKPDEVPDRPEKNPVLYVKTRTIRSGNLTEVECYPVYIGAYRRKLAATKPTNEAMQLVNDRNARKRFERMAESNFRTGVDYALSLTYDGEAPEDADRCNRDVRNYINRVNRARRKAGLGKARYIGVLETGEKGRLHHHLLISGGLDRDQMEQLWGHGYANCDRIQQSKGGLSALVWYFVKRFSARRVKGRHRYIYSRNLKKPRVTESRTRISRRQAERIREDADMEGAQIIRRKFPDKVIEEINVKQSEWIPGCYITVRMRT